MKAQENVPRELTARAILAGAAIGVPLTLSNLYMGLKTGWSDSSNVLAALVAYAVFARQRGTPRALTPLENNVAQTVASAACVTPGVIGLQGALVAYGLVDGAPSPWSLVAWGLAFPLLALIVALPFRRRALRDATLSFPSGLATATLIRGLHDRSEDARPRLRALSRCGLASAAVAWFRDGVPAWIPSLVAMPGTVRGIALAKLTFGVSVSPMMLGVGMLMGPRLGWSMALGAAIAWGVATPALLALGILGAPDFDAVTSRMAWIAAGLMLGAMVPTLVSGRRVFFRGVASLRGRSAAAREPEANALPATLRRTLGVLGVLAALVVAFIVVRSFRVSGGLLVVAALASVPVIAICVRAAGETDTAPVGVARQMAMGALGPLSGGIAGADVMGGQIVAGTATQASALLWALKSGDVLGSAGGAPVVGYAIGTGIGAVVAIPAFVLLTRAHALGGEHFPVPGARLVKALAEAATTAGVGVGKEMIAGLAAGVVVGAVLGALQRKRAVPSPVALSIGLLSPASYALTALLGALIAGWFARPGRRHAEDALQYAAGGLIAGEAVLGTVVAGLEIAGVLVRT